MIEAKYKDNIRPILDKFDKIRDILKDTKIDIPKIVAVGDQSSGKSGIALPKGGGRVTRCPIEIQLRKEDKNGKKGYAKIQIEGDENFKQCTFEELKNEIKLYQARILEICNYEKKIITDKVIRIQVFNERAPDLTLIDLPGLTYIDGKAEEEIKTLYKKYTSGLNTIILLVVSGHNEIDSSESYKCINLKNTIPIYTKIDQILSLSGEAEKLYNKVINPEIKTGYRPIVVRNRSEEEIKENTFTDEEVFRKLELEAINNNKFLNKLDESCKGIHALVSLLIKIQKKLLIESRKGVLEQIKKEIDKLEKEKAFLPPSSKTLDEKNVIFDRCCAMFQDLIENTKFLENISLKSQIRQEFNRFKEEFHKDFSKFANKKYVKKVKTVVDNNIGLKLENFFDDKCVYSLIQEQLSDYFSPNCKEFIDELENIMDINLCKYIKIAFEAYPELMEAIIIEFENQLKIQKEKLLNFYETISDLERVHVFTMNPRYIDLINEINSQLPKESQNSIFSTNKSTKIFVEPSKNIFSTVNMNNSSLFQNYSDNVRKVVISVYCYCNIFENRFLDYLFQCSIKVFVDYFIREPTRFIRVRFKPDMIFDSIEIIQRRDMIIKQLNALQEARKIINNII